MSTLFRFLFVLLLASLHACDARPLGFTANEDTPTARKDPRASMLWAKNTHKGFNTLPLMMMQSNLIKASGVLHDNISKGKMMGETSVRAPHQELAKGKWRRQTPAAAARSTLESLQHDDKDVAQESTVDSNENEIPEDVVVMDYAQPHRKPPIHNKEP